MSIEIDWGLALAELLVVLVLLAPAIVRGVRTWRARRHPVRCGYCLTPITTPITDVNRWNGGIVCEPCKHVVIARAIAQALRRWQIEIEEDHA